MLHNEAINRLSIADRTRVVAALVEGNSIRATCRMTGVSKPTVLKLLADLGKVCEAHHYDHVRGLRCKRVQCDEIWSFVGKKQKQVKTSEEAKSGVGDAWTWIALDADTKLVVSYWVGQRGFPDAKLFMEDVASRIDSHTQLTTDGHKVYVQAVEHAFGGGVDYAMLIKIYGHDGGHDLRYSSSDVIGTQMAVLSGNPDPKHISTSFVERQNLTLRMQNRRFTRLTNAFSKKMENHMASIALHYMHYNFCRVHKTLRVTPAMEAGLANHVWSLEELVGLL